MTCWRESGGASVQLTVQLGASACTCSGREGTHSFAVRDGQGEPPWPAEGVALSVTSEIARCSSSVALPVAVAFIPRSFFQPRGRRSLRCDHNSIVVEDFPGKDITRRETMSGEGQRQTCAFLSVLNERVLCSHQRHCSVEATGGTCTSGAGRASAHTSAG